MGNEDTAETAAEVAKPRRTVAEVGEVADNAYALATAVDEQLEGLSEKVTDHERRIAEAGAAMPGAAEPGRANVVARLEAVERTVAQVEARPPDAAGDVREQLDKLIDGGIDGRIAEALAPVADDLFRLAGRVNTLGARMVESEQNRTPDNEDLPYDPPTATTHTLTTGLGAARKVLELMRLVTELGKNRSADMGNGGKFKFRGVDDAMDAVGHAQRSVGLLITPTVIDKKISHNSQETKKTYQGTTTVRDTIWTTVMVDVSYTFMDPEDGSTHLLGVMAGEGRDAGDKATSKAMAMALKYALLHGLMIPVEGLTDSDSDNNNQLTTERVQSQTSRTTYEENPHDMPPVGARPTDALGELEQRPHADSPPAADTPEASKHERAVRALAAMKAIDRWPAPERVDKLNAIMDAINKEDLASHEVEGATLRAWGISVGRTLGGGQ